MAAEQLDLVLGAAMGVGGTLAGTVLGFALYDRKEKIKENRENEDRRIRNQRIKLNIRHEFANYLSYLLKLLEAAENSPVKTAYPATSDELAIKGKSIYSTFQFPKLALTDKIEIFEDGLPELEGTYLGIRLFEEEHPARTLHGTNEKYLGYVFEKERIESIIAIVKKILDSEVLS